MQPWHPSSVINIFGVLDTTELQKRSRFDFTPEVMASYPTPNYVDPVRRGPALYIFNSMFILIMLVCVTLRLYTRIFIRKWFGLDDAFILCAVTGAIGVTSCVMIAFHKYGWDRHVFDIPFDLLTPSGKLAFASKILFFISSGAVRASVMCLYYRLLNHIGLNQYRWILHVNSVFILGLLVAQQATTVFACSPIKMVWTFPLLLTGKCIDNGAAMFVSAVLNTFSEAVVASLPLPVILSLNVGRRKHRSVIALLCGGFFVVLVGCVRVYYVWQTVATHDPSWWAQPHWICSEVEIDVAIICACVPALTPMLGRVFAGGLPAAKQASPTFSHSARDYDTQRARSLFSKLKEHSSLTGLSISSAHSASHSKRANLQQEIDLEGISNDGFGYSVTITTERGTKVKRPWDIRNRIWHYYPEEPVSDTAEEKLSALSSRHRSALLRGSGIRKKSLQSLSLGNIKKSPIEVQTKKSFEVRESFHLERFDRGFDFRNPYTDDMPGKDGLPARYEEEVEIALLVPKVEVSDWSIFDGEINKRMAARILPDAGVDRPRSSRRPEPTASPAVPAAAHTGRLETSYDSQRYSVLHKRGSSDSVRPKTSNSKNALAHRASRSYDSIRMGVLPSPSTIDFPSRTLALSPLKKSAVKTSSPPPLPLAARFPGIASPAVQPLNSSQTYIAHPHIHQQRNQPSQQGSTRSESTESTYETATSSPTIALNDPQKHQKEKSMRSSMHAENGSGLSVVGIGLHVPPPRQDHEDGNSSDEDFILPLQRPSPRNSDTGQVGWEQPLVMPTINVGEHRGGCEQ